MSSRPTLLRGAALLTAAVVVTGCGSATEPATEGGAGTTTAAAGFPVTVSTAFGDVTVEEEPARVVAPRLVRRRDRARARCAAGRGQ